MEEFKINKIRCLKAETEDILKNLNGNKQHIAICEDYNHWKPALAAFIQSFHRNW